MSLHAVSLFTGIGGIDLAFERAGVPTIVQCEAVDEALRRLAEELSYAPKGWDPTVIRSYRRLGQTSMRLNDQFRLILTFKTDRDRVAVLLEVVDYH